MKRLRCPLCMRPTLLFGNGDDVELASIQNHVRGAHGMVITLASAAELRRHWEKNGWRGEDYPQQQRETKHALVHRRIPDRNDAALFMRPLSATTDRRLVARKTAPEE